MGRRFSSRTDGYSKRKPVVDSDGNRFDSKGEHKRYRELKLLLKAGEIQNLMLKPKIPLVVHGQKVTPRDFTPDFSYTENGKTVVEDYKGSLKNIDPVFKIKWKLASIIYPDCEFRLTTGDQNASSKKIRNSRKY